MTRLEPDDLRVGQRVTVLEWKDGRDQSWRGEVLTVLAIDLPFVVVKTGLGPWHIDIRRADLKALSEEYVAAMVPGSPPEPQAEGRG